MERYKNNNKSYTILSQATVGLMFPIILSCLFSIKRNFLCNTSVFAKYCGKTAEWRVSRRKKHLSNKTIKINGVFERVDGIRCLKSRYFTDPVVLTSARNIETIMNIIKQPKQNARKV